MDRPTEAITRLQESAYVYPGPDAAPPDLRAVLSWVEAQDERIATLERLREWDERPETLPGGLLLEYTRLDAYWQELVKENGDLRRQTKQPHYVNSPKVVEVLEFYADDYNYDGAEPGEMQHQFQAGDQACEEWVADRGTKARAALAEARRGYRAEEWYWIEPGDRYDWGFRLTQDECEARDYRQEDGCTVNSVLVLSTLR